MQEKKTAGSVPTDPEVLRGSQDISGLGLDEHGTEGMYPTSYKNRK